MSKRQSLIGWSLIVAVCLGLTLTTLMKPSQAQLEQASTAAKLLPADAVLYLSWDGQKAHEKAWKETAEYKALYESGLIDVFVNAFKTVAQQLDPKEYANVSPIWETIMQEGFSVALRADPPGGAPSGQLILISHNAAKIKPMLETQIRKAAGDQLEFESKKIEGRDVTRTILPDSPNVELGWYVEGTHLVIAVGMDAINTTIQLAKNERPNLTSSKLWQKYHDEDPGFESIAIGWFDLGTTRELVGDIPLPVPGPDGQGANVRDAMKVIGIHEAGAFVVQSGYKGKASWTRTKLEIPAPRRGLAAALDQPQISVADLPPLPEKTSGFCVATVDWSTLYDTVTNTLKEGASFGPEEASAQLDGVLDQLPNIIGFDPKKGLFDSLGPIACLYEDSSTGPFGFGFGVAVQVKDEDRLDATLRLLMAKLITEVPRGQAKIVYTQKAGQQIVTLEIANGSFNPSYIIDDGWIAFGIIPQAPEAFFLRKAGELPVWKPNADFQEAMNDLPNKFTSIVVGEPEKAYEMLLSIAPYIVGAMKAGIAESDLQIPVPLNVADLPPAEVVTQHLFTNVGVSTITDDGLISYSRSSLPSLPFVGGGHSIAAAPILVALLLPAVQQAREAARRTQSMNNLKQLGLAMHNYHDTYTKFPEGTIPNENLKPEQRLSWIVSLLPYFEQAALYDRIDMKKGWNDDANATFTQAKILVLQNPSVPSALTKAGYGTTHYLGIAGVGKDAPTLPVTHKRAGIFGINRSTHIRDIQDGTSNTIMIGEGGKDNKRPWAGGSVTIQAFTKKPYINGPDGFAGNHVGGSIFGFADGSVRFISEKVDPSVIEAAATIRGGEVVRFDF